MHRPRAKGSQVFTHHGWDGDGREMPATFPPRWRAGYRPLSRFEAREHMRSAGIALDSITPEHYLPAGRVYTLPGVGPIPFTECTLHALDCTCAACSDGVYTGGE